MTYLEALAAELHAVGIRGRLHDRILAEAADHLAEGNPALFGDPRELAQQFADELATDRVRRAAFATFGVLAATGLCFAAAWLFLARAGWAAGMSAGAWTPLGVAGAIGMIVFPQFTFAAGLAMILRAHRRRREPRLPAAEVALLLRRARFALGFDALTIASVVAYAVAFHSKLALWYLVSVPAGAAALAAGAVVAARGRRRQVVRSGRAGRRLRRPAGRPGRQYAAARRRHRDRHGAGRRRRRGRHERRAPERARRAGARPRRLVRARKEAGAAAIASVG